MTSSATKITEIVTNIWELHKKNKWVVVPTNGYVKHNREAVMGRGLARQAKDKFPELPHELGEKLLVFGNVVFVFPNQHVVTFPVKHHWQSKASIELIKRSALDLYHQLTLWKIDEIYIPRVGCGNGQRSWDEIQPLIEQAQDQFPHITTHFVVVEDDGDEYTR
jgi:hypothetical protein